MMRHGGGAVNVSEPVRSAGVRPCVRVDADS